MKVWVVWAEAEVYEEYIQNIWAICGSEEKAKQCIANAQEQVRHDKERWDELIAIACASDGSCLTNEIEREMDEVGARRSMLPFNEEKPTLPHFSIREYNIMK